MKITKITNFKDNYIAIESINGATSVNFENMTTDLFTLYWIIFFNPILVNATWNNDNSKYAKEITKKGLSEAEKMFLNP